MTVKFFWRIVFFLFGAFVLSGCLNNWTEVNFKLNGTLDRYLQLEQELELNLYSFSSKDDLPDGGVRLTYIKSSETSSDLGSSSYLGRMEISIDRDGNVKAEIIDPVILQLPRDVYITEATYSCIQGESQSGNLEINAVNKLPVTQLVSIYPEPGQSLYVLSLPETVDLSPVAGEPRTFAVSLRLYDDQSSTGREFPLKFISSGKFTVDGTSYYLPMYPVETDFAKLPPIMVGGPYDGVEHEVSLPDMSAYPVPDTLSYDLRTPTCSLSRLCFPHIAGEEGWLTELSLVNDDSENSLTGTLIFYSDFGDLIGAVNLSLPVHGRYQADAGALLGDDLSRAGYAIFEYCADNRVVGYAKYSQNGSARAAVPAQLLDGSDRDEIYIPHIASTEEWWTGISLVNPTDTERTVELETNSSLSISYQIQPWGRAWFTFAEQLSNLPDIRANLSSARVLNADGVVGVELFGSTGTSPNHYLAAVPLKGDTDAVMYYPHTACDGSWWTGVVAYNPDSEAALISVTPYSSTGVDLSPYFADGELLIGGSEKYLGSVSGLNFPEDTAWFKLESSQPLTGFELFGQTDGSQLAGYLSCNIDRQKGIFTKLEKSGWTGIAFVNIGAATEVVLTAYNDSGQMLAESEPISLSGFAKLVDVPENIFSVDISGATYISFTADSPIVGFQLNSSADGLMLDAMPSQ